MTKCAVKWIDANGNDTPDDNDAIGLAVSFTRGGPHGNAYPVCAAHVARMPLPGWTLAPLGFAPEWLSLPEKCPTCGGAGEVRNNARSTAEVPFNDFCPVCRGTGMKPGVCNVEIANPQHFDALLKIVKGRSEEVQETFARCMTTLSNLSRHGKVRLTPDSETGLYFSSGVFCGGVIYHPAHDSGVGGPAFAVRFGSEECWQIHT